MYHEKQDSLKITLELGKMKHLHFFSGFSISSKKVIYVRILSFSVLMGICPVFMVITGSEFTSQFTKVLKTHVGTIHVATYGGGGGREIIGDNWCHYPV